MVSSRLFLVHRNEKQKIEQADKLLASYCITCMFLVIQHLVDYNRFNYTKDRKGSS